MGSIARAGQERPPACPSTLQEAENLRLEWLQKNTPLGYATRPPETIKKNGYTGMTDLLSRCQARNPNSSEQVQIQTCFSRAKDFNHFSQNLVAPASMNPRETEIPPELLDPELAINTLSSTGEAKSLAIIERLNRDRLPEKRFIAVPFRANIGALEDDKANYRFFVYVPGEPTKYVMFSGRQDNANSQLDRMTRNVSIVTVARNPDGTRRSYFADYNRDWIATNRETGRRVDHRSLSSLDEIPKLHQARVSYAPNFRTQKRDCHQCHQNGPLPIVFENMDSSPFREQIALVNRTMAIAAPPVLQLEPGTHLSLPLGPRLGLERERSSEWLDKCIEQSLLAKLTFIMPGQKESAEYFQFRARVASAMNCASCHNGRESPPLVLNQMYFGDENLGHYFQANIEHNDMPREHKFPLSKPERRAIAECLRYEFFESQEIGQAGELQSWLFGRSCLDRKALGLDAINSSPTIPTDIGLIPGR